MSGNFITTKENLMTIALFASDHFGPWSASTTQLSNTDNFFQQFITTVARFSPENAGA